MEYLRTPTFPAFRRKRSTPFPPEVKLSEGSRRKPSFFQKAELLSESRASFRKPSFFQKAELLSESRASFRKPSFFQKAELLSESRASFRKPSFFQKAEGSLRTRFFQNKFTSSRRKGRSFTSGGEDALSERSSEGSELVSSSPRPSGFFPSLGKRVPLQDVRSPKDAARGEAFRRKPKEAELLSESRRTRFFQNKLLPSGTYGASFVKRARSK